MDTTLLLNFVTCLFMTGLIWLVQLTHYPSFGFIHDLRWQDFHRFHTMTITRIVAPIMMLQLFTSFALLFNHVLPISVSTINFIFIVLIFMATTFISVPLHQKLTTNYHSSTGDLLVKTNWIRTILWTMASLNLAYAITGYSI